MLQKAAPAARAHHLRLSKPRADVGASVGLHVLAASITTFIDVVVKIEGKANRGGEIAVGACWLIEENLNLGKCFVVGNYKFNSF